MNVDQLIASCVQSNKLLRLHQLIYLQLLTQNGLHNSSYDVVKM